MNHVQPVEIENSMNHMNTRTQVKEVGTSTMSSDGWVTHLRAAILSTVAILILVSGIYPLIVWGLSQVLFSHKANGSLIYSADGNTPIGSELLGQAFAGEGYFQPRPSAAGGGYDPSSSGGTNLGPTSEKLLNGIANDPATEADESFAGVKQLAEAYRAANGLAIDAPVPADAVTRSASGVDPHISPSNAKLQAPRVARVRGMNEADVVKLIDANTDSRGLGVLGEAGVNVLKLNLALDASHPPTTPAKP
jgi:K+-transporting ATPase ATPase C chain